MKTIELTQGKVTLVDDEDYEWLNQWKWYAHEDCSTFYATRNIKKQNGNRTIVKMHREILDVSGSELTDHRDGNGLNNQRYNLRICNNQQNQYNQRPRGGSSKFKGVHWLKQKEKWQARVYAHGKQTHIGLFTDEIEAAKAYDNAAQRYYGSFARINNYD